MGVGACLVWGGFGESVVGGGGCGPVEAAVGSVVVVGVGEFVELGLEGVDGVGGRVGRPAIS